MMKLHEMYMLKQYLSNDYVFNYHTFLILH